MVQAQISKGTALLGGNISFGSDKTDASNSSATYTNNGFNISTNLSTINPLSISFCVVLGK